MGVIKKACRYRFPPVIIPLIVFLVLTSSATADSCSEFRNALAELNTARTIRETVEVLVGWFPPCGFGL